MAHKYKLAQTGENIENLMRATNSEDEGVSTDTSASVSKEEPLSMMKQLWCDGKQLLLGGLINFVGMTFLTWGSCSVNARMNAISSLADTRIEDGVITGVIVTVLYMFLPHQSFHHWIHLDYYVQQYVRIHKRLCESAMKTKAAYWIRSAVDLFINWMTMALGGWLGARIVTGRYENADGDSGFYSTESGISFAAAVGYAIPAPFLFLLFYDTFRIRMNARFYEVAPYDKTDVAVAKTHLALILGFISFIELFVIGDINGNNIFFFRSLGAALVSGNYGGLWPKFIGSTIGYVAAQVFILIRYCDYKHGKETKVTSSEADAVYNNY